MQKKSRIYSMSFLHSKIKKHLQFALNSRHLFNWNNILANWKCSQVGLVKFFIIIIITTCLYLLNIVRYIIRRITRIGME